METKSKELFDLTNVVRYCKGLRKDGDKHFCELKVAVELDGYVCKTDKALLEILVGRLQRMKPHNFIATSMIDLFCLGCKLKPKVSPEELLLCYCIDIIRYLDKTEFNYKQLKVLSDGN